LASALSPYPLSRGLLAGLFGEVLGAISWRLFGLRVGRVFWGLFGLRVGGVFWRLFGLRLWGSPCGIVLGTKSWVTESWGTPLGAPQGTPQWTPCSTPSWNGRWPLGAFSWGTGQFLSQESNFFSKCSEELGIG